jgi:hypothetical protein
MCQLLAYAEPRQEHVAEDHLRGQCHEVLCSQILVQKIRNRLWAWGGGGGLFLQNLFVVAGEALD